MESEKTKSEAYSLLTVFKISFLMFSLLLYYECYSTTMSYVETLPEPMFVLIDAYQAAEPKLILPNTKKDVYHRLIDINKFNFTLNPKVCKGYTEGLFIIILVASNPSNIINRRAIRLTWGKPTDSTKVIFLMGQVNTTELRKRIEKEVRLFGDIVQGTFVDAYRNMTYKHAMGLKWVTHHCSNARYVLKMDDDTIVNTFELNRFLAREFSPWGAKGLILCRVQKHAKTKRGNAKWRVEFTEYPYRYYPNYCAGYAIIYSQDVVRKLLGVLQETAYFWIDDVFITGLIAQHLFIVRTPLGDLALYYKKSRRGFGNYKFIFGPEDMDPLYMYESWIKMIEYYNVTNQNIEKY